MRLHYDTKIRRSLDKSGNYERKDKFNIKDHGRRSQYKKSSQNSKGGQESEIRFLNLKNENRNSFGHLYQNYFGRREQKRPDSGLRDTKERVLPGKRRSLADLKSHFKSKNEIPKTNNTRTKYDSLHSNFIIIFILIYRRLSNVSWKIRYKR